jgi:hypothetical protein
MQVTLADLLAQQQQQQQRPRDEAPKPLPEAQIMMLREIHASYGVQRFAPGDLVMVCKGVACHSSDRQPHIVLEVRPGAEPDFTQSHNVDPSCQLFGARFDIRIATLCLGTYGAFWAESWYFEPYEEAKA